jgi:hypothetical protein
MRADRCTGREQFLRNDITFEHGALMAAVAPGPGHTDPAALPQSPAEFGRPMAAEITVRHPEPRRQFRGDERAHLGPQC